jgi:3-oxoacyl-[acyl-carrier protein] reductase
MDLGLRNRKALVMGASRGIGRQVAKTLAVEGAEVAIFARGRVLLREAAEEIQKVAGVGTLTLAGDSKEKGSVEEAVHKAHREFGRLDILVNCMGGYTPGTFMEVTDEAFMSLIETKLMGYIRAMRAAVPIMKDQRSGHILNIAGNSGKNPGNPHAGVVNASVMNVSKVLSDEVAEDRIMVNCISPGMTQTEHCRHIIETQAKAARVSYEEMVERTASKIPLGFLGEPQDIADLAAFLVSPRNRWISGTNISVDGGTIRSIF